MPQKSLIIVAATPIGHLGELSQRLVAALKSADIIAAEDTRVARKLLNHLKIKPKKLISYHNYSEVKKAKQLINSLLETPQTLVLISDAGTPLISDPGYRLIRLAHEHNIPVSPIAGPSALTALISVAGLATTKILFCGFLEGSTSKKEREIMSWSYLVPCSVVIFETASRLAPTLNLIKKHHPHAAVVVGRELTKRYEEVKFFGHIADVLEWVHSKERLKGECSLMFELATSYKESGHKDIDSLKQQITQAVKQGLSSKEIMAKFKTHGLSRNELYQLLLEVKELHGQ